MRNIIGKPVAEPKRKMSGPQRQALVLSRAEKETSKLSARERALRRGRAQSRADEKKEGMLLCKLNVWASHGDVKRLSSTLSSLRSELARGKRFAFFWEASAPVLSGVLLFAPSAMWAARGGVKEGVEPIKRTAWELLAFLGGDLALSDHEGRTAALWARIMGFARVAEWVEARQMALEEACALRRVSRGKPEGPQPVSRL